MRTTDQGGESRGLEKGTNAPTLPFLLLYLGGGGRKVTAPICQTTSMLGHRECPLDLEKECSEAIVLSSSDCSEMLLVLLLRG